MCLPHQDHQILNLPCLSIVRCCGQLRTFEEIVHTGPVSHQYCSYPLGLYAVTQPPRWLAAIHSTRKILAPVCVLNQHPVNTRTARCTSCGALTGVRGSVVRFVADSQVGMLAVLCCGFKQVLTRLLGPGKQLIVCAVFFFCVSCFYA